MFKYLFFYNNNYLMSKINNDILKYLTNPIYQSNNNIEELTINNEDKDFYRKRILSMSKNIYSGVHYENNLNKAYNDFVFLAINYCKLTDKKDLLQEEYDIIAKQENNIVIPNDNSSVNLLNEPLSTNNFQINILFSTELISFIL